MNELKLLENGLCFIDQSINHLKQSEQKSFDSQKELKYSCLCLFSGISLLLKEKLNQEHWSLLFSNVNKADKRTLETGEFHSVSFSDCMKRLSEIASVKFEKKESDMLDSLRKKRNKIEHFFESESLYAFKSTLYYNLSFVMDFEDKYLKIELSDDSKKDMETIKNECFKLKDFVSERLQAIKPKIEEQKVRPYYCSECNNETIVPYDNGADAVGMKCLFCPRFVNPDHPDHRDELDKFYYDSLGIVRGSKDSLSAGNTLCGACESENTLVDTKDKKEFFCLRCHYFGKKSHLQECGYCGVSYEDKDNEGGVPVCHVCQENAPWL